MMPYVAGQYNQICDVCGFSFLSGETRLRWDGLLVCKADFETDHPQKFVRVQPDGQPVPDIRPEPEDRFVLPIYCTPVTRTCAADNGTADCMTVDYALNIHYPSYGGYPLVYPPPITTPTSTPILFDTFTAANGTDPTSRDMDAYIAGTPRWQTSLSGPLVIESNGLMGVDNGSGRDQGGLLYSLPGFDQIFGAGEPYAVLLSGIAASGVLMEIYADNYAGSGIVNLYWDGSELKFRAQDDALNEFLLSQAYTPTGNEKFAFWTDGTIGHLVINGASVASGSYGLGAAVINGIYPYIAACSSGVTSRIDSIAIYGSISLAEVLTLTEIEESPPPSPLPDIYESGIYELGVYE